MADAAASDEPSLRLSRTKIALTLTQRKSDQTFQGTQPTMLPAVLPVTLPGEPPGGST